LLLSAGIFGVLLVIYLSSDYTSQTDRMLTNEIVSAPEQVKEYVRNFLNALQDDRRSLFFASLVRSFLFVAAAAFVLWLAVRNKLSALLTTVLIGLLAFIDIISVASKYLDAGHAKEAADESAVT